MRKNFGAQPWIYPQPVLIIASYGEDGTPDAMNAAWGGVADRSRIAMYLSGGHKTVKNILKRGAFTVSMGDVEHLVACDYVGIVSGNSVPDKVARAGFHVTKSEHVDAPMIDELPLTLECKLVSFDEETELLLGEVVNVSVDERSTKTASWTLQSCTSSRLTRRTTTISLWAKRSAERSRTARSSSKHPDFPPKRSAAHCGRYPRCAAFSHLKKNAPFFVQKRRNCVKNSLKYVPFTVCAPPKQVL